MNKYEVFFRLLGMTIGIPLLSLLRKICNSVPTVDNWGGFWCGAAGECHLAKQTSHVIVVVVFDMFVFFSFVPLFKMG